MTEIEKLRALLAEAWDELLAQHDSEDRIKLANRIDTALAEPVSDDFRRGAEAMREAAALAVHADFTTGQSAVDAVTRAVRVIRRLPLPEDKP